MIIPMTVMLTFQLNQVGCNDRADNFYELKVLRGRYMTDEQPTISMEEGIRLLQMENGDRLAYLRIFQSGISQIESAITTIKRDIAQYNASIAARTGQPQTIEEPAKEISESEDE